MKKIIVSSLLITQLFTANVFADNELKTSDVFVTATRTPIAKNNVIADTTTISEAEIERAGLSSLTELLQRQPSIEINNNGGQGKVSTFGIRGTSSTHSIVLIDGIRINAATSGFTALENIPLSQIEKIEILRGPASSLYGPDAIGGVIQIFTKKGLEGFKPYIGIGYGRYNTSSLQTGLRGGDSKTSYAINFSGTKTDGFSAFVPNSLSSANSLNLDKDGYKNYGLTTSLNHKINENYEVNFQYLLTRAKNKYDNAAANLSPGIDFRNTAKNEAYALSLNAQINSSWKSSIKISRGIDEYLDKQLYDWNFYTFIAQNNLYKTTQDQLTWQNNIQLSKGSLTFLYDRLEQKIKTTEYYQKNKRVNNGFMVGYSLTENKHNFQTNIRKDFNSNYDDSLTGNLGYAYMINQNWTFATSAGTAFVSPTFNFAYATADPDALGNADLKPEKSKNIEASIRYKDETRALSFTAFDNEIRDFIIYTYGMTPQSTMNLNKAKIQGLSLSGSQFIGHFQISGSVTNQSPKNEDTEKYLPYRSNLLGNINLNYFIGNWNFGVENTGSGIRYDDKANTRKINGYILTNFVADYKFSDQLKINLRLNNALDKDYTINIEGNPNTPYGFKYQTPGRSLFANLHYDF
jgi:vitamin B12 transporter